MPPELLPITGPAPEPTHGPETYAALNCTMLVVSYLR